MGPLEFVASILAGYIALYVMFRVADAWHMGRVRDRRVREWNEMVARERKKEKNNAQKSAENAAVGYYKNVEGIGPETAGPKIRRKNGHQDPQERCNSTSRRHLNPHARTDGNR